SPAAPRVLVRRRRPVSLVLAGLVLAGTGGALVLGRWLGRRRDAARAGDDVPSDEAENTSDEADAKDASGPRDADGRDDPRPKGSASLEGQLEGFVCQLGDVVMRITGEEAWLAGGVVLTDQIPVAVL